MKERERLNGRRAFSPVISALILTAAVLTVGCAIWFFSQSAMTITAEDYAESVIDMTDTISERFIIEHVGYVSGISDLYVWVFNYGDVDIEFKFQIGALTYPVDPKEWIGLASKDMVPVQLEGFSPASGVELNIRAYTRRGNNAYYRFIVP